MVKYKSTHNHFARATWKAAAVFLIHMCIGMHTHFNTYRYTGTYINSYEENKMLWLTPGKRARRASFSRSEKLIAHTWNSMTAITCLMSPVCTYLLYMCHDTVTHLQHRVHTVFCTGRRLDIHISRIQSLSARLVPFYTNNTLLYFFLLTHFARKKRNDKFEECFNEFEYHCNCAPIGFLSDAYKDENGTGPHVTNSWTPHMDKIISLKYPGLITSRKTV